MLLQRFHVFLVDLRGHGSSDAPADDQWLTNSWKCLASDVLVVVEALGIRGPNPARLTELEYLDTDTTSHLTVATQLLATGECLPCRSAMF